MKDIYLFKDGGSVPAEIKRLFGTHGPETLEGRRLDLLKKVQLIVDSSVSTVTQSGSNLEKSKTGSMLGRAVAGAVIAGGAGAVIGGLSGKKEVVTSSISSENINTDLTAELIFEDSTSLYVQIKNIDSFHWLLGYANQPPMTDNEIHIEEKKTRKEIFENHLGSAYQQVIISYQKGKSDNDNEIIKRTYDLLSKNPEILENVSFEDFHQEYIDFFIQRNKERLKYDVDYSDQIDFKKTFSIRNLFAIIGMGMFLIFVYNLSSEKDANNTYESYTKNSSKSDYVSNKIETENNDKDSVLSTENTEIESAAIKLEQVAKSVETGDWFKAEALLDTLTKTYPDSKEALDGKNLVSALKERIAKENQEKEKKSHLELKSLKAYSSFSNDYSELKLNSSKISNKWRFDDHGDEYHYLESEKDAKYVTALVTVKSKSKDPALFGVGIYKLETGALWLLGRFEYRFVRWDDYSSYLGNTPDYHNDFSHASSIPFSIGVSVSDDNIKKPLYIVATREGCHTRNYQQFRNPPVSYSSYSCNTLSEVLKAEDFKDGSLAILKRIN